MPAEQEQGKQRQRHGHVSDDRARERRIHRDVEQVRHRHALVAAQHLADTVIDDDGVVEGITQNREQRRDARQVEIDLSERHVADGEHEIVHVGDHGAERELPFEAKPEVDQDRKDRQPEPDRAFCQKLRRDARPDHFDAAVIHLVSQRLAHLGDRSLLGLLAPGLLGDADQDVVRAAELLELNIAETESAKGGAQLGEIGGAAFRLDLDQRTADEIDAEIETVKEVEEDR